MEFKNLLVTGGCGFIGSNFIRHVLCETDYAGRVVNVDKLTYAGNPENLSGIAERFGDRYAFVKGDVADPALLDEVFEAYSIDAVCHLAAESHVDRSILDPEAFLRTNVHGTFCLLEQARKRSGQVVRFHHVSTDEVYGSLAEGFASETTPYDPKSPYAASKAASDHLVRAYANTYGLPATLSNCSTNFGPYQFPEKLIPLMVVRALAGEPLPVYGRGKNIRDWLYVTDHCRALWAVLTRGEPGETYNVGGGAELENIHVVEAVCRLVDALAPPLSRPRTELIQFVPDRPGHDFRYALSAEKIRENLGWTPTESFASALEKTVSWYLQNPGWVKRVQTGQYREWMDKNYANRR
ncbi:MAG: dTDP-glucose 4,6-dehydratase [Deltaproteobacteria bacterium]|nr:dTDP-glucose 4,6-dehydratase [Deltaproteobacteria bacterium]